jgi:transaldolase
MGILDGVTTNPSLMAKEIIKGEAAVTNHYKTICEIVNGDISAEVISTDFRALLMKEKNLRRSSPHRCKVPMHRDGVT